MRMLSLLPWILLVGCKSKPATPPPAAGSGSAPMAIDAGADSGTAVPPVADSGAQALAEPGCEGWKATKVEHMGMGQIRVDVTCAGGVVSVTASSLGGRDDEEEETKKTLTREAWRQLWVALEAAGWRELPDGCPAVTPPPDGFDVTELELAISDGKTTKKISCDGPNVTARHEQIMEALGTAAE